LINQIAQQLLVSQATVSLLEIAHNAVLVSLAQAEQRPA
jgi:hypothetical protein